MDEDGIREKAGEFVRAHGREIVDKVLSGFVAEDNPVSIFMAGSPGAGKTETSLALLQELNRTNTVRIDADELRDYFAPCGYTGDNSHLFQKSASNLVHRLHNASLKRGLSFLLDGTFANESIARQNIERSLKRGRGVLVIFVYQPPEVAWQFVLMREKKEGRRVRAEVFAAKFCAAQTVANAMKAEFGGRINLTLAVRNIDSPGERFYRGNIDRLDDHIGKRYSEAEIRELIENYPAPAGA